MHGNSYAQMPKGKVTFYNARKGFGFIYDDEIQCDIYFNISGMVDKLNESDPVVFDITEDERGKKAVNIRKISLKIFS